ncbi:hypothetical protein F4775DRAFT_393297 [Biscogniauxia sp. FL1348]|nr:hypothetical protein F4775DRAFT_393297 [Biscogniauxia sp. FL1348]
MFFFSFYCTDCKLSVSPPLPLPYNSLGPSRDRRPPRYSWHSSPSINGSYFIIFVTIIIIIITTSITTTAATTTTTTTAITIMATTTMEQSPLMRAPAEIRMMIYEYLFDDGGHQRLLIQNAPPGKLPPAAPEASRCRSRYYVQDRTLHRRCYETTYVLATPGVRFCAALMRASRAVYGETAHLVYGRHAFDFGRDIEAVEPFLSDLTGASRSLIREVSLYKHHGGGGGVSESDRSEWRSVCRFLRDRVAEVRKLRLVVQAGKPPGPWDGPREFTAADFKLLADIRHESLDWVADLATVRSIRDLEIVPDVHYCPPPVSTSMIVFAAFSASIERGLAEFLRAQLRLG